MNKVNSGMERATSAWLAGGLIVLNSLVHIPANWDALNYFDPPKRLLWALMALVLSLAGGCRENRLGQGPLWLAFGLLIWIGIRTGFRPVPVAEIEVLFTWILPVLMLIAGGGIENRKGARILGGCLLFAGLIQAGIMVLQRLGWDPFFSATTSAMAYKPERMVGTIGYQNQAVDFLALSSTGIFILVRSSVFRLAVLLMLVLVSGLTGNRGGVLAFIAATVVFQILTIGLQPAWSRRAKWRAGIGTLLVPLAVSAAVMLIPETRTRFQEAALHFRNSPATASRILMARAGIEMFKEKPWIGWGAGEYALQYLDRLGAILPEEKTHPLLDTVFFAREAHNDGLQFVAEFGVVGVMLASALLLALVLRLARTRHEAPGVAASGYILAYMAVAGLVSFPWQSSMAGPLAGFLLGWWWPRKVDGETCACPHARIFCFPLGILSLGLAAWFGLDLFLDLAVPNRLINGDPAVAERLLPRVDYRYRALVGAAYAAQGQLDDAERALVWSQRGFRDIALWNNLNNVYAQKGKWGESVSICEKWARCGLIHSNALKNLSVAYEQTGRFAEAAKMLDRRMKMWHTCLLSEVKRLAILQLRSGDPKLARETLDYYRRRWTTADPQAVAELENLAGAANMALGDRLEAEKWFRSALVKDPGLESARRNLEALDAEHP